MNTIGRAAATEEALRGTCSHGKGPGRKYVAAEAACFICTRGYVLDIEPVEVVEMGSLFFSYSNRIVYIRSCLILVFNCGYKGVIIVTIELISIQLS
jgi:hypothetical protein